MGYYVNTTDGNASIPAENIGPAFESVKQHPNLYNDEATLEEVLASAGFVDALVDEDGTLWLNGYAEKSYDEEDLLTVIAPYMAPGSYLEWIGEEGERWRQDFDGTTMRTRTGRTVWE